MPDIKHFNHEKVVLQLVDLFWSQGVSTTGIDDIVASTRVSRSSLYRAFGSKHELYLAALDRYLTERALPSFDRLSAAGGLGGIRQFFDALVTDRCTGEHAGWGCLIVNAHAGPESADPEVRKRLQQHATALTSAFRRALETAAERGELRPNQDVSLAAEQLTLLAYGLTMRSRAGATSPELKRTARAAIEQFRPSNPSHQE
jgi:AcrR family transcriptional regulator